ncbi:hypothetical protein [Methylobacterium gregans]
MSKNMTLPQLNAWLTDKHGGKGAITQKQWDEFKAAREQIKGRPTIPTGRRRRPTRCSPASAARSRT